MLKNKLVQLSSLLLSLGLISCNSGMSSGSSVKDQLQLPVAAKLSVIPTSDLSTLNKAGSSTGDSYCSDKVCIKLDSIPYASYSQGRDGKSYWVEPNYRGKFEVTFKKQVNANQFRLKSLYNILKADNRVVGKITQIDTSQCDSLLKGNNEGKTCAINFMYHGEEMRSQISNRLEFTFAADTQEIVVPIDVKNEEMIRTIAPILNLPPSQSPVAFAAVKPEATLSNSGDEETDISFNNEINDQFLLTNLGNREIDASGNSRLPSINMGLEEITGNAASEVKLRNTDDLVTSCGENRVPSGGTCLYTFRVDQKSDDKPVQSSFYNLAFSYKTASYVINYITPLIVSAGDFIPQNYDLETKNGSTEFQAEMYHISKNGFLRYDMALSDLKFQLKYNPAFGIGSAIDENAHKLIYAYGDNVPFKAGQDISQYYNFNFDSDCFSSMDPFELNLKSSKHQCKVGVSLKGIETSVPLSLQLFATYDSATASRKVVQYIGNASFHKSEQVDGQPDGNYRKECSSINWDGNNQTLSAYCKSDTGGFRNTNLDYKVCTLKSSVGVEHGVLVCDNGYKKGNRLPAGNYLTRYENGAPACNSLSWDGSYLYGSCISASNVGSVNYSDYVDVNLWYEGECNVGSTVSVDQSSGARGGRLQCDTKKSPEPTGSYRQSCTVKSWDGKTLTATCKASNQMNKYTTLDYSSCNGSQVGNRNGSLFCE